jgi:energy-coupling factor transport system substrate-specific component
MHRGQFRRFNRNEGLKSLSVRTICEDKDGNIIVGTTEGIYYIDKHMVLHQLEGKDIADKSIRCLKPCGDGTIYGITLDGCVFTLKDRELADFYEEKDLYGIKEARSVLPDEDNPGYLYIGDSASTIYYGSFIDGKFSLSRRFLTGALTCINSIEKYYGYMWACTDKGIIFYGL